MRSCLLAAPPSREQPVAIAEVVVPCSGLGQWCLQAPGGPALCYNGRLAGLRLGFCELARARMEGAVS